MALDASIPLLVRPIQVDPFEGAAKALKLKKMLVGDQMRNAFVFDEEGGNPVLNEAKTLQNMYQIDPEYASGWHRQQDLRKHWADQLETRKQMLANQQEGQKIKWYNSATRRIAAQAKNATINLFNQWGADPRDPTDKYQDFQNRLDLYKEQLRKQGADINLMQKQGLLATSFDPDQLAKAATADDETWLMFGKAAVQSNPGLIQVGMDDEGYQTSDPRSSFYEKTESDKPEDAQASEGDFVPTAVGKEAFNSIFGSGKAGKPTKAQELAAQSAKWYAALSAKGADGQYLIRDPYQRNVLYTKARRAEYGNTFDEFSSDYMYDHKTGKMIENSPVVQGKMNRAKASRQVIQVYPPGAIQPEKKVAGEIQDQLLNSGARLSRLNAIEQSYDPKWLQLGSRLSATWSGVREKLGANLSAQDQEELQRLSTFKARAFEDLNSYIKELSGATVTDQERARLLSQLPDPGDSWYNGDSPTQFKSKLDNALRSVRMIEARAAYMARNGLSLDKVPLERMPQVMREFGAKASAAIKKQNPKINDAQLKEEVKRAIGREFGITAD